MGRDEAYTQRSKFQVHLPCIMAMVEPTDGFMSDMTRPLVQDNAIT